MLDRILSLFRSPNRGESFSEERGPGLRFARPARDYLSVVIGSYNREKLLKGALESVRAQEIRLPYEIIVVDGGSTDGTLEWLIRQPEIITIVQHNRGDSQGKPIQRKSWGYFMNLGFKAAHGSLVLMLSDDCLLLPNSVNRAIEQLRKLEAEGRRLAGAAFYFRNWPEEKDYYVQKTLGGKLMVNHGIFLRDALEAVGWVDEERYVFYKADSDVCLKLWHAGYEIIDCPEAFVEHYVDAEERVRQANNAVLATDREAYHDRWRGIYLHGGQPHQMGRVTISHDDPSRTAETFRKLVKP